MFMPYQASSLFWSFSTNGVGVDVLLVLMFSFMFYNKMKLSTVAHVFKKLHKAKVLRNAKYLDEKKNKFKSLEVISLRSDDECCLLEYLKNSCGSLWKFNDFICKILVFKHPDDDDDDESEFGFWSCLN